MSESPIVTSQLFTALSGAKRKVVLNSETVLLPVDGAHLWGVSEKRFEGILNHVLLSGRVACAIGKELKRKNVKGYENVDLGLLTQGAILHDIIKVPSITLSNLSPAQKRELGLSEEYREISDEADDLGITWLKEQGFPPEVYEAIRAHDFPEQIIDDPYWKIILLADYMTGQHVMTVNDRLHDVRTRWIDLPLAEAEKSGLPPKLGIERERFEAAEINIKRVAKEIFDALHTSDIDFIEANHLNSDASMPKWERFLRNQTEKGSRNTDDPSNRQLRTTEVLRMLENLSSQLA